MRELIVLSKKEIARVGILQQCIDGTVANAPQLVAALLKMDAKLLIYPSKIGTSHPFLPS